MNIRLKARLDTGDLDHLIREVDVVYRRRLKERTELLRQRVADLIARQSEMIYRTSVADALIGESAPTGDVVVSVSEQGEDLTVVVATGKDAVFIEFGAGIHFNGEAGSSPHPDGGGLGFTIGSFGLGHGKREVWGYYDSGHNLHLTHGVKAEMPLYRTMIAVADDIANIATEVFSS